jgi:hypothetical protein
VWDSFGVSPTVLAPTDRLTFIELTPVPIKLAPPKGLNPTKYIVAVQKQDTNGNWSLVANLPVAANEAQSSQGYMRFGNPGPGFPVAYYSVHGAWRLAAEASSPKQSGWSNWTYFFVSPQPMIPFNNGRTPRPHTLK